MNLGYIKRALRAGLLVGSLDILAAMIQTYLKTGNNPLTVLKFVASGIFGKQAFTAGNEMYFFGLLFHYFIATDFALLFFILYARIPVMAAHKVLTAILYGIYMYAFMQFLVLPFSNVAARSFNPVNALIAVSILIICISIPLILLADKAKRALLNSEEIKSTKPHTVDMA